MLRTLLLLAITFPFPTFATDLPDLTYAQITNFPLRLDLHLPAAKPLSPLIVWVHGGAWRSGSKTGVPIKKLVDDGYAIASVDYRLSTQARFPAQIHDLKAAIRYLRAHRAEWHLPSQIVIAGDSAGGHLAALTGLSNGDTNLEGTVGNCLNQNSDVQGIISFYGASDLTSILAQSTPQGRTMRAEALDLLLGGQPDALPTLAKQASPIFYVNAKSPPLLLFHGDHDPQMPLNQARELNDTCQKAGAPVEFHIIPGAGHGGPAFYTPENLEIVKTYLHRNFQSAETNK